MTNLSRSLIIGCSMLALAACGPDEIASPGTGGNVTINNNTTNPTPAPTPTPTPPQNLVVPAAGCPTIGDPQGLTDEGTIERTGVGEWRVCAMPSRFNANTRLEQIDGLLYRMPGRVDVGTDGGPVASSADTDVTLTIDPGVIIYASGASFLKVNRGNQIDAVGTPDMPIIFTSRDNVLGINGPNSQGQWGGVILSGRGPVTDCIAPGATPGTVDCERQVEGAVDPALFGGDDDTDSSGELRYVQIRYSGFVLSGDSELQSLTTGGIGSGTGISHIQSVNSSDDGVEFFGGVVNASHLVLVGSDDDILDTDTGVKADLQYLLAIQRPGAGDGVIEADSSNGLENQTPRSNVRVSNATFIQRRANDHAIRIRGGHDYTFVNSLLIDESGGTPCLRIDDAITGAAADAALDDVGPPVFESFAVQCDTVSRNGSNSGPTAAEALGFINAGTGNDVAYTNTLVNGYLGGANETGYTPIFDVTALSSFFQPTTFIGAVSPDDDWTQGWTCDSVAVSFGGNTGSCLDIPVY